MSKKVRDYLAITLTVLLLFVGMYYAQSHNTDVPKNTSVTYNVYMYEEIVSVTQYKNLITVLEDSNLGDTVVFHIAGYGGDGETMSAILNAMATTKAYTVAIVEAPSYSAHAYISSYANKLIMKPNTFLMFHTSSAHNLDCSGAVMEGLDRGHDPVPKCKQMIAALDQQSADYINGIRFLTANEKVILIDGYDVYLTDKEVNKRLTDMKYATEQTVVKDAPQSQVPDVSKIILKIGGK